MGWDGLVYGTLSVPSKNLESWLAAETSPDDFDGWPDFFNASFSPRSVEVLIEELKQVHLQPHEFLELHLEGGELTVRAMMAKDGILDTRMELATLFRSASGFGGKGELVFFGYVTADFAYRVKLERAKSSAKVMSKKERDTFERSKPYKSIDAQAQAAVDKLVGAPARQTTRSKKGHGKGKWGVNPFTGKRIWVPSQ
jgi:hypothetical protein